MPKKARIDIQALRGLAILLVVLHHTKIPFLSAGYLGVDVFFVISGFLITGLIKSSIERGNFRLSDFYFRRAKRLLPAAYVVFLVTALLAPLFLGGKELGDFALQVVGAVTFTGNVVLWQQTGYFEGASELKPLLHVWSLAIEEQYYFILPATLVLVSPRRWLPLAVLILIASLALCAVGGYLKPIATFYLLPTRAWELAIGSIGALIATGNPLYRIAHAGYWPALLALVVIPFFPVGGHHPGVDALIVCVATLLVILGNNKRMSATIVARGVAKVGDLSYSLYLVHWPLFAFANNAWAGNPPGHIPVAAKLTALILSFVLSYLLYRFIEMPIHRAEIRAVPRFVTRIIFASLGLIAGAAGIARASVSAADFEYVRRVNYGLSKTCEYGRSFEPRLECQTSDQPSILVWGDSFAMHLIPGIQASADGVGIIQATRSACGPLMSIAPVEKVFRKGYNREWAEDCIAFNDSVIGYVGSTPSVSTVVLASPFAAYLQNDEYVDLLREEAADRLIEPGNDTAVAGLTLTVSTLRHLGRHVVIVAPPPRGDFDIGSCHERTAEGRWLFGAPKGCSIPLASHRASSARVTDMLEQVQQRTGVNVIRFDEFLCDDMICRTKIGETPLYRDGGHLSYDGSKLIGLELSLTQKILELAP